jgi:hypothetical protein
MQSKSAIDEYGQHWICGICLADHDTLIDGERCCGSLIEKGNDYSTGRQKPSRMTARQLELRALPEPEAFIERKR